MKYSYAHLHIVYENTHRYIIYVHTHVYAHIYVCVFMELKLEVVKRQVLILPQRLQATEKHHREYRTYHIYIR